MSTQTLNALKRARQASKLKSIQRMYIYGSNDEIDSTMHALEGLACTTGNDNANMRDNHAKKEIIA